MNPLAKGTIAIAAMLLAGGCAADGRPSQKSSNAEALMARLYQQDAAARRQIDQAYAYAVIEGTEVNWYTLLGAGSGPITPVGAAFDDFARAARAASAGGDGPEFRGVVILASREAFEQFAAGAWRSQPQLAAAQLGRPGEATQPRALEGVTYYRIDAGRPVTVTEQPSAEATPEPRLLKPTGDGSGLGNLDGRVPPMMSQPPYRTQPAPAAWR